MGFWRGNAHLAWILPMAFVIAIAFKSIILFLVLVSLECFSLSIHQFVHHQRDFLGDPIIIASFGCLTVILALLGRLFT